MFETLQSIKKIEISDGFILGHFLSKIKIDRNIIFASNVPFASKRLRNELFIFAFLFWNQLINKKFAERKTKTSSQKSGLTVGFLSENGLQLLLKLIEFRKSFTFLNLQP